MKRTAAVAVGQDGTAECKSKRAKTAVESIADKWVCPITQELPLDPVMAKDHKVYKRTAIVT